MSLTLESINKIRQRVSVLIRDDLAADQRAIMMVPICGCSETAMAELIDLSLGVIMVTVSRQRAEVLGLPKMRSPRHQQSSQESVGRDCYISVEARHGVATGISAADRALTARVLGDPNSTPDQLVQPGHIFPIGVASGGVLAKPSLAEAASDCAEIFFESPSAAFADLLNTSGSFATVGEQEELAIKNNLEILTLSTLLRHRLNNEKIVVERERRSVTLEEFGQFELVHFRSNFPTGDHLVLIKGELNDAGRCLVRVQRALPNQVLLANSSINNLSIRGALAQICNHGSGAFLYLFCGDAKMDSQPSEGSDNAKNLMVMREYGIGAQLIRAIGLRRVELITSTRRNLVGITNFGVEIAAQHHLNSDNFSGAV